MNIDIEKLRTALKNKIDEVINSYITNDSTVDNTVLKIPEDNIYMEFYVNNKNYIAFTEDSKETEEMEMMFAKVEFIDGNKVLRNIQIEDEYESVVREFYRRLELVSDGEDSIDE